MVPLSRPAKPKTLSPDAAKRWPKVISQVEEVGTLARSDVDLIARYCEELVRQEHYENQIRKFGEVQVFKNSDGSPKYVQASCWVIMLNKSEAKLRRMASELGLTPAGRASLHVQPKAAPVVSHRQRTQIG